MVIAMSDKEINRTALRIGEQIKKMHDQGVSYSEIARRYGRKSGQWASSCERRYSDHLKRYAYDPLYKAIFDAAGSLSFIGKNVATRTYITLHRCGIKTPDDLMRYGLRDISACSGIGATALALIAIVKEDAESGRA